MRKKIIHGLYVKIVSLLLVASSVTISCSANSNNFVNDEMTNTKTDSVMRKAVGDSIYSILIEAKSVTATLKLRTNNNKKDSLISIKVGKNDKYVLNFILTAPSNYKSNDIVYGKYVPNFSLSFLAAKGKSCSANFDFGIRKWNICDANGREIVQYDLPTLDVLRLANQLFPNCSYFILLLNSSEK
ncbi:MAG: hypothetical protein LUC91_00050 [Prevotella sp.]|nr:hypothetical protein [Prevotella sp.]